MTNESSFGKIGHDEEGIKQMLIGFYKFLATAAAKTSDYKMAAVIDGGNIVAVTGYMPMITLYNGRFIWVCDLVTDEAHRSKGYGARLLAYVEKQAGENGYGIVSLSSGLQRKDAHRFYEEKMDYDKVSYVFLKRL